MISQISIYIISISYKYSQNSLINYLLSKTDHVIFLIFLAFELTAVFTFEPRL
jgi:hypothetical protein